MGPSVATPTGAHLLVASLRALGADSVFGLPGIHVLPIWDALRSKAMRTYGFRTELNAGFAACGFAHVAGRAAPLIVSTGPGALNSLTAVMEAASSHLPVVVIAGQIPHELIGRRRGYLHELRDQSGSFSPIVKSTASARTPDELPELLAAAFRLATTPPSGPTYVEVPVDVLSAPTSMPVPELDREPVRLRAPDSASLAAAAGILASAPHPVVWAGGGVIRSGAWREVVEVAEILDAPVATTYMGKGAIPDDHPLSAGSACDDSAYQELVGRAGVVLCVGTELGAETTSQYQLRFERQVIQVDADASRIGATHPALGLAGDAGETLRALIPLLAKREGDGRARAAAVRERVPAGLEQQLLRVIREAVPADGVTAWDMTILGYQAAARFPALQPRRFIYPLGSGTLGFAWPAALGAKSALGDTACLAVVGDGGFMYGMSELLTARQHGLAAKLLLVDDGGYGILREYQLASFEKTHGVDLVQPDFAALFAACGIPARRTSAEKLGADLRWAFETPGPVAVVLRERLHS